MVVGNLRGIRTEVVAGQAFALVTVLEPVDCRSIAKASKVRILHLPPRAQRAPDAETPDQGPLVYPVGVSKEGWMRRSSRPRPQGCDLHKRERRPAGVVGRTEYGG